MPAAYSQVDGRRGEPAYSGSRITGGPNEREAAQFRDVI